MPLDLMRVYAREYHASNAPAIIEIPLGYYLSCDGAGDPNGLEFVAHTGLLYAVAYGVRGIHKARGAVFKVSKLEGQWWVEGDSAPALDTLVDRSRWRYRLLIRMPNTITETDVDEARAMVTARKGLDASAVSLITLSEGRCAQILHVGPYATELPTIARLHAFIEGIGGTLRGLHHEIYLGDPRRAAPERLKTILRQPIGPPA